MTWLHSRLKMDLRYKLMWIKLLTCPNSPVDIRYWPFKERLQVNDETAILVTVVRFSMETQFHQSAIKSPMYAATGFQILNSAPTTMLWWRIRMAASCYCNMCWNLISLLAFPEPKYFTLVMSPRSGIVGVPPNL